MAKNSAIEWTDHTFNPWWGCVKVGPGCDNCYAAAFDKRVGGKHWEGPGAPIRYFGEKHWAQPLKWNLQAMKEGRRFRVFCASMADVFDNRAEPLVRARLWRLIKVTPNLDWIIVTKRIGNAADMLPFAFDAYSYPNVWLLITVVNQDEADRDIPKLLNIPARVRGLSVEPMLGPINLNRIHFRDGIHMSALHGGRDTPTPWHLNWVICGGESGHGARAMHPAWAQSLRDQCAAAGVPFFFKQWGDWIPDPGPVMDAKAFVRDMNAGRVGMARLVRNQMNDDDMPVRRIGKKRAGRRLDGRTHDEFPKVPA